MDESSKRVKVPPFAGLSQALPLPSNEQYAQDHRPSPSTQADNLPKRTTIGLPEIPILKGQNNFAFWIYCVQAALDAWDLTQLINPNLRRPDRTNAEYVLWRKWALRVSSWLRLHISEEVVRDLVLVHKPNMYPDELICTISQLLFSTLPDVSGDNVFLFPIREESLTRSHYVLTLWGRKLYSVAQHREVNLFKMSLFMLAALDDEIPITVAAERDVLLNGSFMTMEEAQFNKLLERLLSATE
ncbi:uncharacterized protein LDX57_003669 [Aspergillus melleus]|uniref:uncharacterized protein n=1 Tax=Aspergillus melleus TaxID=138277 RepID=UPI001E8CB2FA|nr:uncharacterized protein LDX57_003669 [Aspergillus melleus]KAH8425928.1 hypothetical protein LDX57_003669 [Aspergillus melleus]